MSKRIYLSLLIAFMAMLFKSCSTTPKISSPQNTAIINEIMIGKQIWMSSNLNVTKFRNGELIPEAKTDAEWEGFAKRGKAAWCYFENDAANGNKYGKLYNWYAVNDVRGLAPNGWHIATDEDWTQLNTFLGGTVDSSHKKIKNNFGWLKNGNGNNSSGFSAMPGGYREGEGLFYGLGFFGIWWTATESSTNKAWERSIFFDAIKVSRNEYTKSGGLAVRCIKD